MNLKKSQLFVLGGLLLCVTALVLLYPYKTGASDDKNQKNRSTVSGSKLSKPANYDAFLASSRRISPARSSQATQQQTALEIANQYEARLGVPTFLFVPGSGTKNGSLNRQNGFTREELANRAKTYLGEYAAQYNLAKSDLVSIETASVHDTGKGAIVVKFKQNIDGVEVFRDEMNIVMNRNLELVAVSGYLTGTGDNSAYRNFQLQPEEAIVKAVQDLTGSNVNPAFLSRAEDRSADKNLRPQDKYIIFSAGENASEDVSFSPVSPLRVKQVFYHLPEGFVPAYYVEANVTAAGAEGAKTQTDFYYSYVISAADGQVLFRNNLTSDAESFSYRTWATPTSPFIPFDGPQGNDPTPHPTGVPNAYTPPYALQNLITLQNSPFSQNDPWLPDGATQTTGNNADAYADLIAPDGFNAGDQRPTITAPGVFDYSFDANFPRTEANQRNMATVQLFYNVNFLHDWFYDFGFNEQAGNAQLSNFGRGGLDNDRMRAEAQDYSGRNNANMNTPADGASPRMQMYLFDVVPDNYLFVNNPAGIAGRRDVGVAGGFGPQVFDVTGDVVSAVDGVAPTTDGCEAFTNAAQVAGKIALIDRGTCSFSIKVQNAQNAGAIAVIIVNNVAGVAPGLGGTAAGITIPTLSLSQADGNTIRAEIPNGVNTRMFRGSAAGDLDGTLDNQVVAHEWGHYISNRLIGNSNGLVNQQGGGMGEGWGDFHALLLTIREEDRNVPGNNMFQGVYSMGGYATGNGPGNSYYFGIRRIPYSTDLNKNALTYKHISDGVALPTNAPIRPNGNPNSQVHNTGEVWATMLLECYASLLNAYPFQEAQDRMKYYLVAGYKTTPVAPTLVEARNAILAAAAANDPADLQRFANAFAKRGLGVRAVAPDRYSSNNAGAVENFNTGGDLRFVSSSLVTNTGDNDGYLDNGETAVLNFTLRNTGFSYLSQTTASISCDNSNVTFPNGNSISLPDSPAFGGTSGGSFTLAANGLSGLEGTVCTIDYNSPGINAGAPPPGTVAMRLNAQTLPNIQRIDFVETVDTPWTTSGNAALDPSNSGKWIMTRPAGGLTEQLWFGPNVGVPSDQYLVTPDLIISENGTLTLSFDHSYSFETASGVNYDGGVIEMSVDGGPWTDIGASVYNGVINGNYSGNLNPLVTRPAFVGSSNGTVQTTITTNTFSGVGQLAPGSTVKVRFRIGTDNAVGAPGWQIDNIAVGGTANKPFPLLVAQGIVTSAQVSVSGRVLRAADSAAGVSKAIVKLTDSEGNVRTAVTNAFGFYKFDALEVGQNYLLQATARNLEFAPRMVSPLEDLSEVDIVPVK